MIKRTLWKPDTCDCEIEYEWDDEEKEDVRRHTVSRIIKACPAHSGAKDAAQNFEIVLEENQRKNILYGEIIKNVTTATKEITTPDGKAVTKLKEGYAFKWNFDAERKLVIDLVGFNAQEKSAVQTIVGGDSKLQNKVIIN